MSAWAEIKHSVNNGLGTKNFEPLNKIVEKEAYRSYYREALLDSLKNPNDYIKIIDENNFLYSNASDTTTKYFVFPPNKLRVTGSSRFSNCTALERIDIPSSVYIENGETMFRNCTSLTHANLDFFGNLSNRFFEGCSSLYFVRISKNISKIGMGVFRGCPIRIIVYGGTQNEWLQLEKDPDWDYGRLYPDRMIIECIDGQIYDV